MNFVYKRECSLNLTDKKREPLLCGSTTQHIRTPQQFEECEQLLATVIWLAKDRSSLAQAVDSSSGSVVASKHASKEPCQDSLNRQWRWFTKECLEPESIFFHKLFEAKIGKFLTVPGALDSSARQIWCADIGIVDDHTR